MASSKVNGEHDALRSLYKEDGHVRVIFDDFAGRTNNSRVTEVDKLLRRLRHPDLPKWAVTKLFKQLGDEGYGRFVVGRHGSASRFIWSSSMIDVGKAAQGEALVIEKLEKPEEPEIEMVSHQFRLRPEMSISIQLPANFSAQEADRFAQFLKALPFSSAD